MRRALPDVEVFTHRESLNDPASRGDGDHDRAETPSIDVPANDHENPLDERTF